MEPEKDCVKVVARVALQKQMTPLRLYSGLLAAGAAGAIGFAFWLRSRKKSPAERERLRRQRIAATGRITDGMVMDVCEVPVANGSPENAGLSAQLLIFHYDVAGVTYEASQDVTYLRQFIDLHTCKLGVPASIKYDPQNPGNSIVISEEWSGLRKWPAVSAAVSTAGAAIAVANSAAGSHAPVPAEQK